jgi:hypothetical protein
MPGDFWSDADIIDIYTRRQAIENGILVQLSGPGYQGDQWIPAMVAEAGFRYPIAMTATVFVRCVSPIDGEGEQLAPCQDIKGRLWDVLWMLKCAIHRAKSTDEIRFELRVVPNVPQGSTAIPHARLMRLKALCGPGDNAEPVITIMLPEED